MVGVEETLVEWKSKYFPSSGRRMAFGSSDLLDTTRIEAKCNFLTLHFTVVGIRVRSSLSFLSFLLCQEMQNCKVLFLPHSKMGVPYSRLVNCSELMGNFNPRVPLPQEEFSLCDLLCLKSGPKKRRHLMHA